MRIIQKTSFSIALFAVLCLPNFESLAQNNVGIGTRNPDFSAVAHIQDSLRGLLIPRTDTQSVWDYVNSLIPNPGITHGLTIFETNVRQYYIFNGFKQKWEPITNNVGPRGATGVTGPTGPRGDMGVSTKWRDEGRGLPVKINGPIRNKIPPYFSETGDTCGDFYHETATGLIWSYNCDSSKWIGPIARWRNFGVPHTESIQALGLITRNHPASPAGNALTLITGLSKTIQVPPDTIAYVFITSEGVVQKSNINYTAFNKVAFDFFFTDDNNVSSYMGHQQVVTIGPNINIVSTSFSQFDKVPWNISTSMTLEGHISPPGNPLPATNYKTWRFQTHAGQYFNPGNPVGSAGAVTLVDNAATTSFTYENFAVMNIYIVFERSKNAPYPN